MRPGWNIFSLRFPLHPTTKRWQCWYSTPHNNKNVELMSHDENHTSRQHDSETYESGLNGRPRVVLLYDPIETENSASQHQRNRCDETQSNSLWTHFERRNDGYETCISVCKRQRSYPLRIDVQRFSRCNKSEDEQQLERFISEPIHNTISIELRFCT